MRTIFHRMHIACLPIPLYCSFDVLTVLPVSSRLAPVVLKIVAVIHSKLTRFPKLCNNQQFTSMWTQFTKPVMFYSILYCI